jgi:phosphoglycerate dehydrogenase-like enzyme
VPVLRRPHALLVMDDRTFDLQFRDEELARLAELAEVDDPLRLSELDSIGARRRLAQAEVLLTSWGTPPLTPERLASAPRLRAVLHAAGSVRGLLGEDVFRRGVVVSTAAAGNAVAVAEYTLAAIIMAGKKAPALAARHRITPVSWSEVLRRDDLSNRGRTVVVVGFSQTGRRVVELLRLLDTAAVLVVDPYADAAAVRAAGARLTSLDEALRRADVVSLHAPALPLTHHMISARELGLLPQGATLVNTARGSLIDHDALFAACASGRVDAILDVTEPEPLPVEHPLLTLPNVLVTPHIAGSLGAETRRMAEHALDELQAWCEGRPLSTPLTAEMTALSA